MSYVLWHGTPIKMRKGTISMWFRVPEETARAFTWVTDRTFAPLQNVIPILTFSGQHTGPWTEFTHPVINTFMEPTSPDPPFNFQPFPYHGSVPGPTWELPYHPCLVAVYIDQNRRGTLAVILQTMDVGLAENTNYAVTGAEGVSTSVGLIGPTSLTFANASDADARMEWFDHNYGAGPEVKFDVWHHLLLSWDLKDRNESHGNAYNPAVGPPDTPLSDFFDAKSTMYCAFDDKNLNGNELPTQYWADGFASNDIACTGCFHLAGNPYFTVPPDNLYPAYTGLPTYTVTFARGIEMDVVAVPSEPKYQQWKGDTASPATEEVDAIKKIEVAELQIFSDLLLNTTEEFNRRAFIAFKEHNTDQGGEATNRMEPVDPKETERILGRRPDILLHGTRNWKKGKNTGKIGLERDPVKIIESGQFTPNGEIKKWLPDPRLLEETANEAEEANEVPSA